jgi:hypothetical protein
MMQIVFSPDQMTAEVERRVAIDEGRSAWVYDDATGTQPLGSPPWAPSIFKGFPTAGIGCNLAAVDAALFARFGADLAKVLDGTEQLTEPQIDGIFADQLANARADARASLNTGVYDALAQPRQFVLDTVEFNLGQRGWLGFAATRALINQAQAAKEAGKADQAHVLFGLVANHLRASAWDSQVGNRARRCEAMMRTSLWCSATGDGSDIL